MLSADLGDFNPEYDADFSLGNNDTVCNYLWNNEWFGNQEDENNKFTILDDFVKEGDTYIYTVQTYMYDTPMFQFEVKTVLEGQQYKIGFIQKK